MSKTYVPSIEATMEGFPQRPDKIRGLPTYETLAALKKDLLINASSVPCTLGGGSNGYLGALLSDQAYAAVVAPANTPFVPPAFPGNLPANLNGTAAQVADQVRVFDEQMRQWREYDTVTKALRKQIINSVENAYLSPLQNQYSGYNNVDLADMLSYLFTEYGAIDDNDLMANNKKFEEPWDGAEPLENVITWIQDCCDFAEAAEQPYTAQQILSKAFAIVFNTGLYFEACQKWKALTPAQKTLANFRQHFLKDQRENLVMDFNRRNP
jgi:hypothetical protein